MLEQNANQATTDNTTNQAVTPDMNTTTVQGGQPTQTPVVETNSGVATPTQPNNSVESVVASMTTNGINNAVNNVMGQVPVVQPQENYGERLDSLSDTMNKIMTMLDNNNSQNNDNSQNNENIVDTPVQNATINTNERPFNLGESTNNVTDDIVKQLSVVTTELNNMKVSTIKNNYSLSDSDYNFVSQVATQVGIDILNDPTGLQNIINTIEANNKVVIGEQRVQQQGSDAEIKMRETGNYLRSITGGRL